MFLVLRRTRIISETVFVPDLTVRAVSHQLALVSFRDLSPGLSCVALRAVLGLRLRTPFDLHCPALSVGDHVYVFLLAHCPKPFAYHQLDHPSWGGVRRPKHCLHGNVRYSDTTCQIIAKQFRICNNRKERREAHSASASVASEAVNNGKHTMNIDPAELASRLKNARLAAEFTQEQVANAVDLPRSAIAQLEAGNRSVSTLELANLATLYGRPIASFFEDQPGTEEPDPLLALFRAANAEGDDEPWQSEVSHYLGICRAGVELDRLLKRPPHLGPPSYDFPKPRKIMEAVEQGNNVAEQERHRLGLGHNPVPDMADLINSQNIWASGAHLPDEMSGLFLKHGTVGLCILVNYGHPRARKRFSYAHEYAHALLDRDRTATVSFVKDRSNLHEVRANAFAASFLLPRTGVWSFLNSRFKGGPSVVDQAVYDPATESTATDEVRARRRATPGSQEITYEDAAALAHHFGVSYQAAAYRLKSLGVINEAELSELREKEPYGKSYLDLLELDDADSPDTRKPDREIVSQVIHLALEAYRQEEISQGKLRDLSSLLKIRAKTLLELAEAI